MPRLAPVPLLLLLPLVYAAGRRLARRAVDDAALGDLLGLPVAIAGWVLSVHVLALLSHDFYVGLFVGTLLVAALGLWAVVAPAPVPRESTPLGRGPALGALLSMVLLAGIEARFFLWDENIVTGHQSIPNEMLLGFYPPRHLSFAQFELKYHYGFDLFAAMVSAVLGRPEPFWKVMHLTTLGLFGLTGAVLWAIGERFLGRGKGKFAWAGVVFAGGVPINCEIAPGKTSFINCGQLPQLPGNFLQHPWTLGMPLGLATVLLFSARRTRSAWWWGALSLLMVALSLSQVVFFGCLLLAIAAAGSLTASEGDRLRWWQRWLAFGLWSAAVIGVASQLHGFFAHVADPPGLRLEFQPFWKNHLPDFEWYVLCSMGFMLWVAPFGLRRLQREKLLLGLLGLVPLLVYQFFKYPDSWDVAKFLMMAELPLGLATGAAFARWFARVEPRRRWLLEMFYVATIGLTLEFYAVGYLAKADDVFVTDEIKWPTPADEAMGEYLKHHIRIGEVVLRSDAGWNYAVLAGLPVTHTDWGTTSFGFTHKTWDTRSALIDHPSPDSSRYLDLGIVWLVLSPKDKELRKNADQWVADGRAESVMSVGDLTLIHLRR